jgi:hypothetical protein
MTIKLLGVRTVVLCCLFCSLGVAQTSNSSTPLSTILLGDSPFALAVNSTNTQVVAVHLFPFAPTPNAANINISVVNTSNPASPSLTKQFLAGTRLVAVAATGTQALIINEDQNALRIINIATETEIPQSPITTGSRPSNVAVVSPTQAVVTNGTGATIQLANLTTYTAGNQIAVGPFVNGTLQVDPLADPRAVAVHPDGRYAYVALGGDNLLDVVDLSQNPPKVIGAAPTGTNPVAIAIAPGSNPTRAVVTNLTNNTATIFDVTNPALPVALKNVPVCSSPTSVAAHPTSPSGTSMFFIGCEGSGYFVELDAQAQTVAGTVQMCATQDASGNLNPSACTSPSSGIIFSSGVAPSSDGKYLYVLEFQNRAYLRVYDLANLKLDPPLPVVLPGEPTLNYYLSSTGTCSTSFFVSTANLVSGAKAGQYSLIVSVQNGLLTGGFSLGGAFTGNAGFPSFGQFQMPSNLPSQPVTVTISDANAFPGQTGTVGLAINVLQVTSNGQVPVSGATVQGSTFPLSLTIPASSLTPGNYYTVTVTSLPGSPSGTFDMQMASPNSGFQGGVVVGGYAYPGVTGYGAYCVPASQIIDMVVQGITTFGANAAGPIVLGVKNNSTGTVLRIVDTSNASAGLPALAAPPMPTTINYYVDATAKTNGTGTSTSPFNSITNALKVAGKNQVIFVRPGTYSPSKTGEVIPMDNFQTGQQLVGAGSATTIIDGEFNLGSQGNNGNILVITASNVRIAGFTFTRAQLEGIYICTGCKISGGTSVASNVVVESNVFTYNQISGLSSAGAAGLVVQNNQFALNSQQGMAITNAGTTPPATFPFNFPAGTPGVGPVVNCPGNASSCTCPASPFGNYGAYIVNNITNSAQVDGVLMSQGGNICLFGNTVTNNGSSGIEFNNRDCVASGASDCPASQQPLHGEVINNYLENNGGVQYAFGGTGILSNEGNPYPCVIDLIQGNVMDRNHPANMNVFNYGSAGTITGNTVQNGAGVGISVQLHSNATEISNNTVTNNALNGIFVSDHATVTRIINNTAVTGNGTGLSILLNSTVATVDSNTFDTNGVGGEVSASNVTNMTNNTFIRSSQGIASTTGQGGGLFVDTGGNVGNFTGTVTNNQGQGAIVVYNGTMNINNATSVTNNSGNGLQIQSGSSVSISSGVNISNNGGSAGIFLDSGGGVTLTGVTLNGNNGAGIQAGSTGTTAKLASGVTISNTKGYGLNAQNGATITCTSVPTYSGNTSGNALGSTSGCGSAAQPQARPDEKKSEPKK